MELQESETGYYTSGGEPYSGPTFEDDKGRPFGEITETCSRCGGSGKWHGGRGGRKVGRCFTCDGQGERFDQCRLYTADQIQAKWNRKSREITKREEAESKKAADIAARHAAFVSEHAALMERAKGYDDKFIQDLLVRSEIWGGLTEAQTAALETAMNRIDEDKARYANSRHIGSEGDRIDVEVTCQGVTAIMKEIKGRGMTEVFITNMIDTEGNAFVSISASFKLERGESATIRGTVKAHDDRYGWPRTVLTRAAILERTAEPSAEPAEDPENEAPGLTI